MKIVIFDFEVFFNDVLFGCIVLEKGNKNYFQTWDKEEIKKFYFENQKSIWVGWNIARYDNLILEAIIKNKNPKTVNDDIIKNNLRKYCSLDFYYYDLIQNHSTGLKTTEAYVGKNISESLIDFDIERSLTLQEKIETENYNRDDLDQTYDNFIYLKDEFELRLEIIKEFDLSYKDLNITGTQIAEKVLGAKKIYGIENQKIVPEIYSQLKLKNKELLDYFLNDEFRTSKKLSLSVCGLKHQIGAGGIHGAKPHCFYDWALYLDVSGYYNLVMLNYDLLPRSLSKNGKELYEYMYHQQLELKGKVGLEKKRQAYKVILLAVFGAMINEYSKFYDPWRGLLVTITGQLFLFDLLEKLDGKVDLIQSNTDGIMLKPLPEYSEEDILKIVKDWCNRTGFVIKPKKIYNIIQRDVNNYIYKTSDGSIETKGEAVKHYEGFENPFGSDGYSSTEALIISKGIVEYLVYDKLPEKTIEENKLNLRLFQYICKKNTFDYLQFEKYKIVENKEIKVEEEKIQNVNRAFASKDKVVLGKIIKYKNTGKKSKVSNLPNSVFIFNDNIRSEKTSKELSEKIDYDYYIQRIYEKCLEFIE